MASSRNSRVPSPARSQGSVITPRRLRPRRTLSVESPARSNTSRRLSSIVQQYKENIESHAISPLVGRMSLLTDNTDIEEPGRKSWWKKLEENSRDVMEILDNDNNAGQMEAIEEIMDYELLSQKKKDCTADIPDSSDSESINSIVIPQRKLFTQKDNQPKKFGELIGERETLAKLHKTSDKSLHDKTVTAGTKELFRNTRQRMKPIFPAALLNISPNKTAADKTREIAAEPKAPLRNIFGNRQGNKRKNIFANFVVSESEDEVIPEIQAKVFGFHKTADAKLPIPTSSRGIRDSSPTSSITTDIEMDEWQHLPSSTMIENKIDDIVNGRTPVKRIRLSKLTEAIESDAISQVNSSKQSKKSAQSISLNTTQSKHKVMLNQTDENLVQNFEGRKYQNTQVIEDEQGTTAQNKYTTSQIVQTQEHQLSNEQQKESKLLEKENDKSEVIETIQVKSKCNKENQFIENKESEKREVIHENGKMELVVRQIVNNAADENKINENGEEKTEQSQVVEDEDEHKEYQAVQIEGALEKSQVIEDEEEDQVSQCVENKVEELEQSEILKDKEELEVSEVVENEELVYSQVLENGEHEVNEVVENDEELEQSEIIDNEEESEVLEDEVDHEASQEVENEEELDENDLTENEEEHEEIYVVENEEEVEQLETVKEDEEEYQKSEIDDEKENQIDEDKDPEQNLGFDGDDDEDDEDKDELENNLVLEERDNSHVVKSDRSQSVQKKIDDSEIQEETDNEQHDVSQLVGDEMAVQEEEVYEDPEELDEHDIEEGQESVDGPETEDESQLDDADVEEEQKTQEEEEDNDVVESENESEEELSEANEKNESETHEDADNIDDNVYNDEELIDESDNSENPNVSHDTTGRNRRKNESPEVVLHDKGKDINSFTGHGRDTSVRKTKSMINHLNIRPSLAPVRESTGISDGTRNSSAEGSGWDSHRTTRKTLRQTLGKDFTPRKSLRALVMEKSAKRQTTQNAMASDTVRFPQANSTELPEESANNIDNVIDESDHELSRRTRQTTLEKYLQKVKNQNMEKKLKMEEAIRNSIKEPTKDLLNPFKVPAKPFFAKRVSKTSAKPKTKPIKSHILNIGDLPAEVLDDMKYKPPKRFQPNNSSWITKRLYNFLENKLESKYDYKARVRSEKLVENLYYFAKELRRHDAAPRDAVHALKAEMARLGVVRTHFDFYEFFHEYMPREIRVKVVPDVVNKIPLPRHGVFSDILRGNTVHG